MTFDQWKETCFSSKFLRPSRLLAAALLFGVWALAIRQLALEWTVNAQYQYGWAVPVLTVLLWWRLWPGRPSPGRPVASWLQTYLVVLLAILALPLRVIEEANPEWRLLNYYFAGQAILITAIVVNDSGGRTWLRYFAFPLLFPLIAVPWPSGIEQDVIQGLQRCVAGLSVEAASWMGWGTYQRGNLIVLSHGIVGINEACSGIRSLQSSLMIALFLGAYFQLRTRRRWILIALAVLLAFALNVTRAFLLITMMELRGIDAMSQIHDPAGFGISLVNLLLLWIVANKLAGTVESPGPVQSWTIDLHFPLRSSLILLVAWAGAELLTVTWYQWHERDTRPAPVWTLRWPPSRPNFKEEKIDDLVQSDLRYDEGWHGTWRDTSRWDIFFFTWKPSRAAAGLAESHHPDICLPAAGYRIEDDAGVKTMDIDGLALPVHRYVFQDTFSGRLFYVFQAITDDKIRPGEASGERQVPDQVQRLQAAWEGRRNPGERSLLVVNQGAANLDAAEAGFRDLLGDSLLVTSPR